MSKPSDLPYFPGKELAMEAKDRGIKVIGVTDDIKDPMLIGLIQIVEELREELRYEIKELRYEIKMLKEQS